MALLLILLAGERMATPATMKIACDLEAEVYKALGHPIRLRIVKYLQNGNGRRVSEIVKAAQAEQSNVSRHLAILRQSGVLVSRKEGLNVFYSLRDAKLVQILTCVSACIKEHMVERNKAISKASEEVQNAVAWNQVTI